MDILIGARPPAVLTVKWIAQYQFREYATATQKYTYLRVLQKNLVFE